MKVLVLIGIMLGVANAQTNYGFNCAAGDPCTGAAPVCDWAVDPKLCTTCDGGFEGYDCTKPTPAVACTTGVATCGSNGACDETTTGTEVCICNQGFFADPNQVAPAPKCVERVRASACTLTTMTIEANLYQPVFPGFVYIVGLLAPVAPATVGLPIDPVPNACYLQGTPLTLTYTLTDATCDLITPDVTTDPTLQVSKVKVRVQHDPNIVGGTLDFDVEVECKVSLTGSSADSSSGDVIINPVGATPPNLAQLTSTTDSDTGLTLSVTDAAGAALSGAQDVGTPAFVVLKLDTSKGFDKFNLQTLTAQNADGSTTLDFVLLSCPLRTALVSMTSMVSGTTPGFYEIKVGFKIFTFTDGTPVSFTSQALLCDTLNVADCAPVASGCLGATEVPPAHPSFAEAGIGRRRRRQAVEDEKIVKQNVTFFVVNPNTGLSGGIVYRNIAGDSGSCLENMVFLLPLVLLAVLLVVAMGFAIFFCLKVTRRDSDHSGGMTNSAYKA